MSLSVLCVTRDPGARVAAMLGQLRHVADEIVVAADSRVGAEHLGWYAAVADRLLRFEHTGSNRALAWAHGQCACDWVLRVDGDEVPSPSLVERLPALIASRQVFQYWFPTRWLFPDAGHWLEELPWWPDFHNRLVRNDGSLWFPGVKHSGAGAAFPAKWLHEPLYHLDLVIRDGDDRIGKIEHYEAEMPGLRAPGGGPFNAAYYLPERHARRAPAPVPEGDRRAIDEVLGAAGRPPAEPAPERVPLVAGQEIERFWSGRALSEADLRARIEPFESDHRMYAGERRAIHVEVTNAGGEHWPSAPGEQPAIRATYSWLRADGSVQVRDGLRTPLPASLAAGDSCVMPVAVQAPRGPGDYDLEIDLLCEPARRFGSPLVLRMAIEVAAGRRSRRTLSSASPAAAEGPPLPLALPR